MSTESDNETSRENSKQETPRKQSTVQRKRTQTTSSTTVTVQHDVKNSIIIAISGITLLPGWLSDRFALYARRPLSLLLDLPWWALGLCSTLSAGYTIFTLFYYGTDSNLFSKSWSLFVIAFLERSIILVAVATALLIFIVLGFMWIKRRNQPRRRSVTLPWGFRSLSAALITSVIMLLITGVFIGITQLLRHALIPLNISISLVRADELVRAGQFDQGREILALLPAPERKPPYMVSTEGLIAEESEEGEPEPTDNLEREVRKILDPIADTYFQEQRYGEVILAICSMKENAWWNKTLPWLREAIYFMAHTKDIGPEKTLEYLQEVIKSYPECKELISPFWLVTHPFLAKEIDDKKSLSFTAFGVGYLYNAASGDLSAFMDTIGKVKEVRNSCLTSSEKEAGTVSTEAKLCEFDLSLADQYLEDFPDDPYADIARFLLEKYDSILTGGYKRNPHVLDMAYYEKGRRQIQAKDFKGAIRTYQSFLSINEFKDHPWRDDALWRIAQSYMEMGLYTDALDHLSRMDSEGDQDVPEYAEMYHSILYMADVRMPTENLIQITSQNHFPKLQPILAYTLAERLLVEDRLEEAEKMFKYVSNKFGSTPVPPKGVVTFAQLVDEKLSVIEVLKGYRDENSQDYPLLVADYLDTYEAFSPFENDLRNYILLFAGEDIPVDYITQRSKPYLTAQLREGFIADHPNDPRVPDLLYQIASAYETVSSWELLPTEPGFLDMIRDRAASDYIDYIKKYPNHNSDQFDRAMEHAGSLYLYQCNLYGESGKSCDRQSLQRMRETYLELVKLFPRHRLANNMLNWVAFSYCYEANLFGATEAEYRESYEKALETYQLIAERYPDGLTGQNARENILTIEKKLANPSEREEIPEARWGWYSP